MARTKKLMVNINQMLVQLVNSGAYSPSQISSNAAEVQVFVLTVTHVHVQAIFSKCGKSPILRDFLKMLCLHVYMHVRMCVCMRVFACMCVLVHKFDSVGEKDHI